MNGKSHHLVVLSLGLSLAGSAVAADYTWVYREEVGTSPMNPAQWSDPSNWDANGVPDPADTTAFADLQSATNRYIVLPCELTLRQIRGCSAGRPVLIGEGTLTLTGVGNSSYPSDNIQFFVPLSVPNSVGNVYDRLAHAYLAADVSFSSGVFLARDNKADLYFHQDWYANDDQPSRSGLNLSPENFLLKEHYGAYHFFAPPALAAPSTSAWRLTKGSPYATRVGTVAHELPVGTHVTSGGLLKPGTFLRRIFPDGTVEFSQPAEDDAQEAEVTFDAFVPDVQHSVPRFQRVAADGGGTLYLNQGTELGSLRFVAGTLVTASYTTRTYVITSDSGYEPGTLVISNATTELYVKLSNGRIEFRGTDAAGTDAGLPNGYLQTAGTANAVVVPGGVTAKVGAYYESGLAAKLTKEGAGTLVLPGTVPAGSGKIVVKEGVVMFAESADGLPLALPGDRLQIEAGATLKLPKSGARFSQLPTCADGATIAGPALLVVADALDASALPLADNVQVVKASQYDIPSADYSWNEIPAATSPLDEGLPVPASWMDASVADSLVTSNGETQVCLLQWKDVRGAGHPSAVPLGESLFPEVVTNADGTAHHVYFAKEPYNDYAHIRILGYTSEIPGVRAVFKVSNGRGSIICAQSYTWMRAASGFYNWPVFWNGGSSEALPGVFYVNGEVRDERKGSPYAADGATDKSRFDPQVVEFHFPSGGSLPTAQRIGGYNGGSNGDRNGHERLCETLVYTNELTFVQRQKICAYLMKKWMHGAEANQDYGTREVEAFDAADDVDVPVPAGGAMAFVGLEGPGTLRKTGPGDLYVKMLENASGGLHVAAGRATVASTALSRETLPGDPYIHLDASDATTITEGPTAGTIAAMADVRGAGHPSATVVNAVSGKYPTLVANAQGELPMVDYGSADYSKATVVTGLRFPETDRLYSVFRIAGGVGGGVISGYLECDSQAKDGELYTVARMGAGLYSAYAWVWGEVLKVFALHQAAADEHQAGGPTFRLDGVDCNATTAMHVSGVSQLLAYSGYDHIHSDSLGCCRGAQTAAYNYCGNSRDGETILYTNALSRASTLKVEAYLNKKWFGKETPGFRPAFVGTLAVDAGATLDIVGGAPVTASSFASAGTVNGAVALASGATIELVVNADGSVTPLGVTGGVDFSLGGTVVLSGDVRALAKGDHAVAAALGDGFGAWTVTGEGLKDSWEYQFVRSGDSAVLRAVAPGLMLIFR